MSYKRNFILVLFLFISSYSLSSFATPKEQEAKCFEDNGSHKTSEIYKERVLIIDREFEKK